MQCPHYESADMVERQECTELGYRHFRCRTCKREWNERTETRFNYLQYPTDVVCLVVLWWIRYKLCLRDLPELFLERGMVFSHEAVREWEAQLGPLLSELVRKHRRGRIGARWYTDEPYIKVKRRWTYLYCAMDRDGNVGDVYLSATRNKEAAEALFRSARSVTDSVLERITTDGHDAYPGAIRTTLGEGVPHRTNRYWNNHLGQDQRGIKQRTRPMGEALRVWKRRNTCAGSTTKYGTVCARAHTGTRS